jgi:hypothetical protein
MNRVIVFSAALVAGLSVSVSAFANGSTWTMPYFGQCASTSDACSQIDNISAGSAIYATGGNGTTGKAAISAVSYSGQGVFASSVSHSAVYGYSGATSNSGAGVEGYAYSSNQGVGVRGQASLGGTAIWGYNPSGTAAWFDGYVYVANTGHLQVYATPYCSGCTAWTNNSDIRLKKNVKTLEGALDRLLQLRGVTFEWKNPSEHGNRQGVQRGFIAQEVEKVIPEWVGVDSKVSRR